jgi:hypothetical protein
MRKLVILGLIALIDVFAMMSGTVMEAQAFDQNDLAAIQTAVHGICVQPDQKGQYLKVDGDLSVGAILRIVGVNGAGKITKETWEGISQRADQYKTDPRQCAAAITPILVSAMSVPRDCSGRTVERYGREFDVTRESPEMGGGHTQPEWCESMKATLRGEQPGADFSVVRSGEHTNNHCSPFNCPQYVYTCTIHVRADPVCH